MIKYDKNMKDDSDNVTKSYKQLLSSIKVVKKDENYHKNLNYKVLSFLHQSENDKKPVSKIVNNKDSKNIDNKSTLILLI